MTKENVVAIHQAGQREYPNAPFDPAEIFPEFAGFDAYDLVAGADNRIYESVRKIIQDLGYDEKNVNTSRWNPFRDIVRPGSHVVIKPNLVYHSHPLGREGEIATVTNASLVRPIIDYLLLAAGRDARITICDVPLQQTDFDKVVEIAGFRDLVDFYSAHGINIGLIDLRLDIAETNSEGVIIRRAREQRDPLGYSAVDLGQKSQLMGVIEHYRRLQITDYGRGTVPLHHNRERNEYLICNTVLDADLFINVPKLKTHRKAAITFAMKNLIGINGDKSWIAHHRSGSARSGGDEFPSFTRKNLLKYLWVWLKNSRFKRTASFIKYSYRRLFMGGKDFAAAQYDNSMMDGVTDGSWWGNDTIWRCIVDLNAIVLLANKKGSMTNTRQRHYLTIGDGVVAGEGEGPMENTPKPVGILLGGRNPVYVDRVAAQLMGFDYRQIPQIAQALASDEWGICPFPESEIDWVSNLVDVEMVDLNFKPPRYWDSVLRNASVIQEK